MIKVSTLIQLFVGLFLVVPQETDRQELTFIAGEPQPVPERLVYHGPIGARVPRETLATLTIRPSANDLETPLGWMPPQIERALIYRALSAVFGVTNPDDKREDWSNLKESNAALRRDALQGNDDGARSDRWTILAADEPTCQRLAYAIVEAYRIFVAERLEEKRAELLRAHAKAEKLQTAIARAQAEFAGIEQECQELGVLGIPNGMIDDAIARIDQEQRLNDVDIAGVEAGLAAARKRLEVSGVRGERGSEPEFEVMRALHRVQVELEIQLATKLGRREAIGGEVKRLRDGETKRARLDRLRGDLSGNSARLESQKETIQALQSRIQKIQERGDFVVVDGRVIISPVLKAR